MLGTNGADAMDAVTRVQLALSGKQPDRVPWGELTVPLGLVERFVCASRLKEAPVAEQVEAKAEFLRRLGMDIVVVEAYTWRDGYARFRPEAVEEVRFWRQRGEFYVLGLINGGLGQALCTYGLEEVLKIIDLAAEEMARIVATMMEENLVMARELITAGAQGIIIGDDFAYSRGPFLPPYLLQQVSFPYLKKAIAELKQYHLPVIFHACGNINGVLDELVTFGFDTLHSLQPTAGMKIEEVKKKYGAKISLWGNLDIELLYQKDLPGLEAAVRHLMTEAAAGGGYIFGTSSGLDEGVDPEALTYLAQLLQKYGSYE